MMNEKMLVKKLFFLIVISFFSKEVNAQFTGLWEVTRVSVGSEETTPVAKWTHLYEDGSYTSGNGWLQNTDGKWSFDPEESKITAIPETGFDDPFGPFEVTFENEKHMIWVRDEGGQKVEVYYERVEAIPKSLPDLVVGIWDIETATREGEDVLHEVDPTGNRFIFLRWDHLVRDFTSEGRVSGVWRIDAHRPVLDILYYDTSMASDYWQISFNGEDQMMWQKEDLQLTFSRLTSLPD